MCFGACVCESCCLIWTPPGVVHLVSSATPLTARPSRRVSTEKPSRPRCYAEGPTEVGKDVMLRCVSAQGTNPLQYIWEKISDSKLLPAIAVLGNAHTHLFSLVTSTHTFHLLSLQHTHTFSLVLLQHTHTNTFFSLRTSAHTHLSLLLLQQTHTFSLLLLQHVHTLFLLSLQHLKYKKYDGKSSSRVNTTLAAGCEPSVDFTHTLNI